MFTIYLVLLKNQHALKTLIIHQVQIRANNSNYVIKNLINAIMKRSKLRNKYLRERTNEAKSLYNKQSNLFVSILHKNKRDYFENLSNKIVSDNRKFGKPFFCIC